MSIESRKVPEENFGALEGCLVEGDPQQRANERHRRRRSLFFSVLLQSAALIAVVIAPLLAKTERITLPNITPVPPYAPYRHAAAPQPNPHPITQRDHHFFAPTGISPTIPPPDRRNLGGDVDQPILNPGSYVPADPGGIPIADARPRPVEPPIHHAETPHVVHVTNIDPAMLKKRIDPIYPLLAQQTRREGRVELHAMIGADGSIQSLQIVSGDALFYASALAAVQQWVYKPTYLNGVPVQVDTTITVIYTMQH